MKRIKRTFIAIVMAAMACGYFSINSTNEVICSNVEALTEEWDGRTLKPNEHVAYNRFLCGNPNKSWTIKWIDGKATGICEWNNEIQEKIGVCVVAD